MPESPQPAPVAWDALVLGVADLARLGASEALRDALDTLDRAIQRTGERLGTDPVAAAELAAVQARLEMVGGTLAQEQARIGRDLVAVQAEWQARARYLPGDEGATLLDRRG